MILRSDNGIYFLPIFFFRRVVIEQTKTNKDSDTIAFFFADFVKYFRSAFLQKPSE